MSALILYVAIVPKQPSFERSNDTSYAEVVCHDARLRLRLLAQTSVAIILPYNRIKALCCRSQQQTRNFLCRPRLPLRACPKTANFQTTYYASQTIFSHGIRITEKLSTSVSMLSVIAKPTSSRTHTTWHEHEVNDRNVDTIWFHVSENLFYFFAHCVKNGVKPQAASHQ